MGNKQSEWRKVIRNINGFLDTISDIFQIGKENKRHSSKSVKCDYKCHKEDRWVWSDGHGQVKRMEIDRLPKLLINWEPDGSNRGEEITWGKDWKDREWER